MGIIILSIAIVIIGNFLYRLGQDSSDIGEYGTAMEKYKYITEFFDESIYQNQSTVSIIDKSSWVLKGTQGSMQRFSFQFIYGAGNLTILYTYPIYPKIKQHDECIFNVRDTPKELHLLKAEEILQKFIDKMNLDMPLIMEAERRRTSEILGHNRF